MTSRERHTVCWLVHPALGAISVQLDHAFSGLPNVLRQEARKYLLSGLLPGIVRRGQHGAERIPLGFCFPLRWQEQRLRLATEIALSAIKRYSTPEQTGSLTVTDRAHPLRAVRALSKA